jgi:hypothetical protein
VHADLTVLGHELPKVPAETGPEQNQSSESIHQSFVPTISPAFALQCPSLLIVSGKDERAQTRKPKAGLHHS